MYKIKSLYLLLLEIDLKIYYKYFDDKIIYRILKYKKKNKKKKKKKKKKKETKMFFINKMKIRIYKTILLI